MEQLSGFLVWQLASPLCLLFFGKFLMILAQPFYGWAFFISGDFEMSENISIYNPAKGIEGASFCIYTNTDDEAFERAQVSVEESLKLLAGVHQILAAQASRGRCFNLTELTMARRFLSAWVYVIKEVRDTGSVRGGEL